MPNLNNVQLMGRITRDVEIRVTPKGTSIGQFGMAINREWRDESGSKKEEVTFLDLEVWGKQAETLGKYCGKGSPLFVLGRLKVDSWDDKTTGQKRSKVKVVVESFQFLGKRDDSVQRDGPSDVDQTRGQRQHTNPERRENIDEDCPF